MKIGEIIGGPYIVTFEQEIPAVGDQTILILDDNTEVNVRFLSLGKWDWYIENGVITGLITEIEAVVIEDVRPSSRGKLKLV